MAATLQTRLLQAQATEQPFVVTLTLLLQDELDCRRTRLSERRFKQSGLDERPTLAEFDWRFNPKVPRQACFELHTLKFITEGTRYWFGLFSHQRDTALWKAPRVTIVVA